MRERYGVRPFDRVAFIAGGRIATVGNPAELRRAHGRRVVAVEWRPAAGPADAPLQREEFDLDGLAGDAEFQRRLADERVETIHSQETTLDQVFIEVTGEALHR